MIEINLKTNYVLFCGPPMQHIKNFGFNIDNSLRDSADGTMGIGLIKIQTVG